MIGPRVLLFLLVFAPCLRATVVNYARNVAPSFADADVVTAFTRSSTSPPVSVPSGRRT
jgi:hypothetical protein